MFVLSSGDCMLYIKQCYAELLYICARAVLCCTKCEIREQPIVNIDRLQCIAWGKKTDEFLVGQRTLPCSSSCLCKQICLLFLWASVSSFFRPLDIVMFSLKVLPAFRGPRHINLSAPLSLLCYGWIRSAVVWGRMFWCHHYLRCAGVEKKRWP